MSCKCIGKIWKCVKEIKETLEALKCATVVEKCSCLKSNLLDPNEESREVIKIIPISSVTFLPIISEVKYVEDNNDGTFTDLSSEIGVTLFEVDCCEADLIALPLATERCQSYGNIGSGSLNARLSNPALFNDPASNSTDPGAPDFTCLNHYPIDTVIYEIQVTTDSGANWSVVEAGPKVISTWNSQADVQMRDDGFGMGMSELIDAVNSYFSTPVFKTRTGNGWMEETAPGVEVRVKYGFIYNSNGDPACRLDPFHRQWTDDFFIMATDGDAVWLDNSDADNAAYVTSAPDLAAYKLASDTHNLQTVSLVPTESCQSI